MRGGTVRRVQRKKARAGGEGSRPAPGVETGRVHFSRARPTTRAPVFCPHFGPCGGCQLLDIPYRQELATKEQRLRTLLAAARGLEGVQILPILAARRPLFWRTSLKIPFGRVRGRAVAGFFRPGSHRIVDLETCVVQDPRLVELVRATRAWVDELGVPVYDETAHRGILRHLVARVASGTEEWLAGLVVRKGGTRRVDLLARWLWARFAPQGLAGIVENVNPERTNVILGPRSRVLAGRPWLAEKAGALLFHTSLESFARANRTQAAVLYAEVLRLLGDVRDRDIVELYAGHGPLGMRLAQAGARVLAIDRNAQSAREGADAAQLNDLADRIRFETAGAEEALAKLAPGIASVLGESRASGAGSARIDAVVVDPPRRGLTSRVIDALCRMDFPVLVYVSCNPVTLVRDLELLATVFAVRRLRPVDLFPRLQQVEVVALLERRARPRQIVATQAG